MATTTQEPGIYLVGVVEGTREGREFKRRDGSTAQKMELGIRLGEDVVAVQADDSDKLAAALDGAGVGDGIALRVHVRLVKDFDRRYAFITYELPLASGEARDAGWS